MDIPSEIYGLPFGAVVIVLVDQLKNVGLPSRWAGLTAAGIGAVLGTLFLVANGQPWVVSAGKGIAFGLSIVMVHYSVVSPIADANKTPTVVFAVPPPTVTAGGNGVNVAPPVTPPHG